jgi:hypothetical protein
MFFFLEWSSHTLLGKNRGQGEIERRAQDAEALHVKEDQGRYRLGECRCTDFLTDVISDLPKKTETKVFVPLTPYQVWK